MYDNEQYRRGRSDVEMSSPEEQRQSRREPVSEGYDPRRRRIDDDERSRRSRSDIDASIQEEPRDPKREPVSEGYDQRRRKIDDDERSSRRSRSDVDTGMREEPRHPKREPVSEGYDQRRRKIDDDERSSRRSIDTSIQDQARMESQGSRRREQSLPSRKADSQSENGKGRPHVTMEREEWIKVPVVCAIRLHFGVWIGIGLCFITTNHEGKLPIFP